MTKAIVVHIITKLELGGAQQNTLYTCANLDHERFDVRLLAGPDGMLDDEAKNATSYQFVQFPDLVREVSPLKDTRTLFNISLYLKKLKGSASVPVIVHTHSSKAGVIGRSAAASCGCDVILHSIHGFGFDASKNPLLKKGFLAAERLAAKYTDHFIAVSEANMRLGETLELFDRSRCSLIRSGIKLNNFILTPEEKANARKRIRSELGFANNAIVAGMIACLKSQKAPLDFVEVARKALRQNKRLRFFIAGDGELRSQVEAKLAQGGLNEHFRLLGWRRDIPELLAASDMLVLTSLWEGLPRVIPQAMCAKLPVVATNVDGIPEAVIQAKNGLLFQSGDVEGIASGILQLASDKKLREQFGKDGFARVSEWDIDRMVRQQEELYEKLLDKKFK